MPEGDTIHRVGPAHRVGAAAAARSSCADAPNPRSPDPRPGGGARGHGARARRGARQAPARSTSRTALAVHSHLGMNGRWRIAADGATPFGKPWLVLSSGRGDRVADRRPDPAAGLGVAGCETTRRSRSSARTRSAPGFDLRRPRHAACAGGAGRRDRRGAPRPGDRRRDRQRDPKRRAFARAGQPLAAGRQSSSTRRPSGFCTRAARIMRIAAREAAGGRPRSTAPSGAAARACGGPVSVRGQGDANRATYWCPRCQP